jgi:hypothetical protein
VRVDGTTTCDDAVSGLARGAARERGALVGASPSSFLLENEVSICANMTTEKAVDDVRPEVLANHPNPKTAAP